MGEERVLVSRRARTAPSAVDGEPAPAHDLLDAPVPASLDVELLLEGRDGFGEADHGERKERAGEEGGGDAEDSLREDGGGVGVGDAEEEGW